MRSGLKNHRRHQRIEARINGPKAGRFAADVLEGLVEEREDEPMKTTCQHDKMRWGACRECKRLGRDYPMRGTPVRTPQPTLHEWIEQNEEEGR